MKMNSSALDSRHHFKSRCKMIQRKRQLLGILSLAVLFNIIVYVLSRAASWRTAEPTKRVPVLDHTGRPLPPDNCHVPWKSPLVTQDKWQVAGKDNDTYVFSAYLDLRVPEKTMVRVVGITSTYKLSFWSRPTDHCRLWYRPGRQAGGMTSITVPAERLLVPETHERKYGVMLYTCVAPSPTIPDFVSLVRDTCDIPLNTMPVVDTRPTNNESALTFTVCVAPFLFGYNNFKQLVATVEASLAFGAEHFVFYNHSMGMDMIPYLQSYVKDGLATVVDWQEFPVEAKRDPVGQEHGDHPGSPEIHYFAQVAAINDCVYRNLHNTKFLLSQDLDELIVPVKRHSWGEMMDELPQNAAAFIFRNVFFPLKNENHGPFAKDQEANHIHSLLKTLRQDTIFQYGDRSKYVVNMELIKTLGIHTAYDTRGATSGEHTVSPSVGLLHHYRDYHDDSQLVEDLSALTFAQDTIKGVKLRLRKVEQLTGSAPVW